MQRVYIQHRSRKCSDNKCSSKYSLVKRLLTKFAETTKGALLVVSCTGIHIFSLSTAKLIFEIPNIIIKWVKCRGEWMLVQSESIRLFDFNSMEFLIDLEDACELSNGAIDVHSNYVAYATNIPIHEYCSNSGLQRDAARFASQCFTKLLDTTNTLIRQFSNDFSLHDRLSSGESSIDEACQLSSDSKDATGHVMIITLNTQGKKVMFHWRAHYKPLAGLLFSPCDTLLLSHAINSTCVKVWSLVTNGSSPHCLFKLERGRTSARIDDIIFSSNSKFVILTTVNDTGHMYLIHPAGMEYLSQIFSPKQHLAVLNGYKNGHRSKECKIYHQLYFELYKQHHSCDIPLLSSVAKIKNTVKSTNLSTSSCSLTLSVLDDFIFEIEHPNTVRLQVPIVAYDPKTNTLTKMSVELSSAAPASENQLLASMRAGILGSSPTNISFKTTHVLSEALALPSNTSSTVESIHPSPFFTDNHLHKPHSNSPDNANPTCPKHWISHVQINTFDPAIDGPPIFIRPQFCFKSVANAHLQTEIPLEIQKNNKKKLEILFSILSNFSQANAHSEEEIAQALQSII